MITPPTLSWAAAAAGKPGTPTALGKLSAGLTSGETLQSLIIDGLPPGALLTDGLNSFTAGPDGGLLDVTGWNLAGLSITLPAAGATAETFTLTAVATVADAAGDTASASIGEAVTIAAPPGQLTMTSSALSAPAPQMPGLFAGYPVRPSWQVAGVDYGVGVAAGTKLLDPAGLAMAGVSISGHYIDVTGNNVTLSGYDFSLEGGWCVYITGANDVIENSNFQVGINNLVPVYAAGTASNTSILNNTIDGGGVGVAGDPTAIWSLISSAGTGMTVEGNWLKNAPQHIVEFSNGTLIDENNLIQNVGFYNGAHVNDVQFNGGVSNGSVIAFNTVYDPAEGTDGIMSGGEGLQVEAQLGSTITNTTVENNTVVSVGPGVTESYLIAVHQDAGSNITNGVNVVSNFLDSSGAYGPIYGNATGTNLAFVNNIDLTTGAIIAAPAGTASTNVASVAVTSGGGTVAAGGLITIAVTLNEAVSVTGLPVLNLNDGGTAVYSGRATNSSGDSILTFSQTVTTSDVAVAAVAVTGINYPTGATILDAMGDNADLAAVSGALSGAPAVAPGSGSGGSGSGGSGGGTTLTAGTAIALSAYSGIAFSGTVASFTDSNPTDSDLTATISWGDGSSGAGTVTDVAGAVSVSASHTYAAAGTDTVKVTLSDPDGGSSAGVTTTATVISPYKGSGATVTTPEGTAFKGTVASFTDANTTEAASAFTATIAWGDGTTSPGAVSGGSGSFTVSGGAGHAYANPGAYTIATTVTDTTNGATLALTGSATATDANVFTVSAAPALSATAGMTWSGTAASFTDSYTGTPASGLVATIAWGDGSTSAGTITETNGAIAVAGSHTYTAAGTDTVSVTIKDTAGTASATATGGASVTSPFKGSGATLTTPEGTAFKGTVASFTDANTADPASSFSATIAWGDGTTSAGTVSGGSGSFTVSGGSSGHAYASPGSYSVTTTVTDTADSVTFGLTGSATATDANVFTVTAAPAIGTAAGATWSGTVASFTDSYTGTPASGLAATIAWGDGTTSSGTITETNGAIAVAGSHTYAAAGSDTVSVTLKDTGGTATATATGSASVNAAFKGSGDTVTVAEGTAFTGAVAGFTDSNTADQASLFAALIAWGDGTSSAGTVSGGNGSFSVAGASGHAYANVGSYTVTTTVTDTANSSTLTITGGATATDANVFTPGAATAIGATAGTAFSGTVATFADSYTGTPASGLAATIAWGDGTTGTGTITETNGAITVAGAHTYAAAGTDTVSVTIKDTGGTASATATTTATVAASIPQSAPAAAPAAAAAQLPGLFAGYAVRPSWQVAGVDYAVGMPAGTVLKDPSRIAMTGVSVNTGGHTINVSGNNVTLNGYDFSLGGGWTVYVTGANDIIENSNFKVGTRNQVPIAGATSASNLSILHDTIDGGGVGVAGNPSAIWSLIAYSGTGLTVEYNWLKNAPSHVVEFRAGTLTDEYNLIQSTGFYAGASVNDVQFNGGVATNSVISFNTVYNPPHAGQPTNPGEGLQVEAQLGATLTNTEVENNTVIAPGPSLTQSSLIAIHQDSGANVVNGVNVEDNYLDATGATAAINAAPGGSNLAFINNVNLVTGAAFAAPSGVAVSNVSKVAVTSGTATAAAGATVTIAVTLNEAMKVTGLPALVLNDGGTAVYSGGSGTNTLSFSHIVTASDIAVPALAITGVNLTAGAAIADAAGDNANLSAVTKALSGAPAIAPGSLSTTSSALLAPAVSGTSNAMAFIVAPGGATAAPGLLTPWLGLTSVPAAALDGAAMLAGFAGTPDVAATIGAAGAAGASAQLPLFAMSAEAGRTKLAEL